MRLILLIALTMSAFAANSLLTRAGVASGTDPLAFAALRVAAGAATLAAIAIAQRGHIPFSGRHSLASAAALTVYLLGFSLSYLTLDAGLGALILFATVQLGLFALALARSEAIPLRRWLGMGMALAGLAYLLLPGADTPTDGAGAALMIAAGLGWAAYTYLGKTANWALGATAMNFALAAAAFALIAPLWWGAPITATGAVTALASGALASGLGYALWFHLLPKIQTTTAGVAQLSVPVIAILGGAVLLAEPFGLRTLLSCALVLGGIAVATVQRTKTSSGS